MLSDQILNSITFMNQTEILNFLDFKQKYASWKSLMIDDGNTSFLVNSFYFFIIYVPVMTIIFYTLQIISKIFLKFSPYVIFYGNTLNALLLVWILEETI